MLTKIELTLEGWSGDNLESHLVFDMDPNTFQFSQVEAFNPFAKYGITEDELKGYITVDEKTPLNISVTGRAIGYQQSAVVIPDYAAKKDEQRHEVTRMWREGEDLLLQTKDEQVWRFDNLWVEKVMSKRDDMADHEISVYVVEATKV